MQDKDQELYDRLCAWAKAKASRRIGDRRCTFLVMVMAEGEDDILNLVGHVDPDLPEDISMPPLDYSISQQTFIVFKEMSESMWKKCQESSQSLTLLTQIVGKQKLRKLIGQNKSFEGFRAAVKGEFGLDVQQHAMDLSFNTKAER